MPLFQLIEFQQVIKRMFWKAILKCPLTNTRCPVSGHFFSHSSSIIRQIDWRQLLL